jgi:pimeloyl-ACP methyl ester carboxylesterase
VFLGGTDAHVFDDFAPKFTQGHHVYGVSQQGFGKSSAPEPTATNYTADHLADGVLAVLSQLNINRPVLVGHSLAGEELSSIGSRYPQRVTGLIYLDGGYAYAFTAHRSVILPSMQSMSSANSICFLRRASRTLNRSLR